ncbi:hypothetical protein QYE76_055605 [Lolium multiflorum]|uniref:Uncharacterized protein n=1 Tax=Lolium multiflorum TaxID=4521 RepID=A0AAD8T1C3_LOLMU|nr:hypothetical protein QYE76_055605 [Lolium multiflorum]
MSGATRLMCRLLLSQNEFIPKDREAFQSTSMSLRHGTFGCWLLIDQGAKGEQRGATWARPRRRGPRPAAPPCSGAPHPFRLLFFAYSFVPKPKPQRGPHEGLHRLCGESTRERALRRARIRRGNSLPEGEIDAIAIVIERDIISIIIIIISTIYTAITTARISMNEVRKKLFTISLSGKAAHWYKLLKNGDSIDWEDIVPLFYSKFYPPSEIHKDRNRIYNFWPHDGESIAQAWGRLKSLMLKCPIHELPGNVIIDNFYARLSFQDKTLLDTSCSGSFTRKNEEFKRDLLDRIQENTEGWENDKDRESVKDLVTENVEDGHIIFCEDASNIVSHPNKSKQVSVPMLSVRIGDHCYYGLCDIGASVSAIPYELYTEIMHEIGSCELEDIDVVIHLANRETISPIGIVRDVEVLCGKIKYPADFLCASIVLVPNNPLQEHLENSESEAFRKERDELEEIFLRQPILKHDLPVEDLGTTPPPKEDPVFDLKPLPDNLKYAHIDDKKIYPVIISSKLSEIEEERLLEILKKHRGAIGYTLDDLKGISPSICQHAINMEEDAKPVVEHQRRLIPKMKEVRCEETNLVLNWEKCHFMVNEGIVLGHKISERGIEVDRAKVEAIEKMPYPRDVKGIRSVLGHAVFSKISKPLTNLLQKDVPFVFDDDCKEAFETLKKALTTAPVVEPPDWNLPFEIMCDARKLLSKWEGPYVVEEVYRSGAIKISSLQGNATQVVNGQRLKHYISGDSYNVDVDIIQVETPRLSSKDKLTVRQNWTLNSTMVSNNKDKGPWREEMDERINKEKEKIASEKESGKLRGMTEGAKRGSREEPCGLTTGGADQGPAAPPVLGAPQPLASFSSRTPSSRKPKPREDLTKGYSLAGRRAPEKRALRRARIREIPPEGKSTPSPSSSSGTSSPSSSSSSPPSTPPSPPLHLVIAVAIRVKS